jgi:hypothetical protein
MSWLRYSVIPVLICPALLLTGALKRQADRPAALAVPAVPVIIPPAVADPAATEVLAQAVETLNPNRVEWLEATVWQKAACAEITYQAEGRFRAGPQHRLHLTLVIHQGNSRGEVEVVSDGTVLWQSNRVDGGERTVSRMELQKVLQALASPDLSPEARAQQLQPQCFAGLGPLLQGLRHRMVVTGKEAISWRGRQVLRLTLVWSPETAGFLAPPGQPWPDLLPRQCLLYLDAATLWPHRLEWWGPAPPRGEDSLVFQMEFRDPVWNQPLSREQCAREFSFDPGPGEARDANRTALSLTEARTPLAGTPTANPSGSP